MERGAEARRPLLHAWRSDRRDSLRARARRGFATYVADDRPDWNRGHRRRAHGRPGARPSTRRGRALALGDCRCSLPSSSAWRCVYFEALFRSGRLAGLDEFDGWAFWVPKAKAIYFFGGLDPQFFPELPGPSYPPLVPALSTTSFHFMGSADVVTLHLQFWFFLVGFVAAVAGLSAARPRILLWPPILLLLVTPHVRAIRVAGQKPTSFSMSCLLSRRFSLLALARGARAWSSPAQVVLLAAAMLDEAGGISPRCVHRHLGTARIRS